MAADFFISQGDCQQISLSGVNAVSATTVKSDTVGFYSEVDCYIKVGASPVATATGNGNIFLPAGVMLATRCNQSDKVAAITTGASGVLYVYSLR